MTEPGVKEFFKGLCVLVTGATGFLGKAVVEKLVRSCPEVDTVYLLIRPKKKFTVQSRLDQLLKNPLFDRIKTENPDVLTKLFPISGDIELESLGMTSDDWKLLTSRLSVVIHSAATVKFDECLSKSLELNVNGLRRVIKLCREIKYLKSLVHISTAYTNCDRKGFILEEVYPPPLGATQILRKFDEMDNVQEFDTHFSAAVKTCRPNTYTYTKAIAEHILTVEAADLPVCIVRPSVVTASWKEPVAGWVDNLNGSTGIFTAAGVGALRVFQGNPSKKLNLIPIDVVVNLIICAAWETSRNEYVASPPIKIYNGCSPKNNLLLRNKKLIGLVVQNFQQDYPLLRAERYPSTFMTTNRILFHLAEIVLHFLPAITMDIMRLPKSPRFVKSVCKIRRAVHPLEFFPLNEWHFSTGNVTNLCNKLNAEDQKNFNFMMEDICWPEYLRSYCAGIRRYVIKEEDDSLPKARSRMKRLYRNHLVINIVGTFSMFVLLGLLIWTIFT